MIQPYYRNDLIQLYAGDSLQLIPSMIKESIDVIIADPPYFLSNGGFTNSGGKKVSVNKGNWDEINDKYPSSEAFNALFLKEAQRVLKPTGTIWIFGSLHNIYEVGYLLKKYDYRLLNNITWQKLNPPPNLSCRMFTHSTETILWARKFPKVPHFFNYNLMRHYNQGKQMKDVWSTPVIQQSERRFGRHPTQKPISIIKRMIEASTTEGMTILDPFVGSGTTAVACQSLKRYCIGIDSSPEYLAIAKRRLENQQHH
ncbi:MAG TPA: site-specific DNA-methyltransferase [Levilactobacillus hammesii]|uniref:Methyltransferase n=1 Tax=Levilactobacillus hammesii TaxID=267633 RepID=A0A921JVL5_9LACO|nr:site-specific DNA-methyltransferase [Levilactobacillus hammesii]